MKSKLSVSCALACAAGLAAVFSFGTVGTANAATVTITGSYTVSYTPIHGNNPTIADDLGSWVSGVRTFTETLTFGAAPTTGVNFITVTPSGSCGSGCVNNTASGTLTVNFAFSNITVLSGSTTSDTALYQAKYSGSALSPCALNSGSGQTDCVTWSGHAASQAGGHDTLAINFQQGSTTGILDIILNDAEDWAITPKIQFQALTCGAGIQCGNQGTTPIPGALPLFASGLGGGLLWLRRKRKIAA
jgi:hypothetical protein